MGRRTSEEQQRDAAWAAYQWSCGYRQRAIGAALGISTTSVSLAIRDFLAQKLPPEKVWAVWGGDRAALAAQYFALSGAPPAPDRVRALWPSEPPFRPPVRDETTTGVDPVGINAAMRATLRWFERTDQELVELLLAAAAALRAVVDAIRKEEAVSPEAVALVTSMLTSQALLEHEIGRRCLGASDG